ncbi:hypothetical protein [Nocardioides sp. NPDC006273]|uniref:hypothetical protein n=1 Tax=Nocardioides sp. NPDC006273 TaxID=3155598 RepID=UPI0033ADE73F
MDPTRTSQKKDYLAKVEKLQAQQAALTLRVLAASGDIAAESGDKDASARMRAELLVDKGAARAQIKLATSAARYELVAAGLAEGVVSEAKAQVITKALDKVDADPAATSEDPVLAEKLLVDYATQMTTKELRIIGKRILVEVDPGRFEEALAKALLAEEGRAQQKTALRVWDNGDGTVAFDGVLPVSIGMRFKKQVEAWAQPRKQRLVDTGAPLPGTFACPGPGQAPLGPLDLACATRRRFESHRRRMPERGEAPSGWGAVRTSGAILALRPARRTTRSTAATSWF